MKVKLLEVDWLDDQIKAKVESPICKNMSTVLRDEDLKKLIPHSMGVPDAHKIPLIKRFVGKYIEINNLKGAEKTAKRDRKMKLTVNLKDGEGFDTVAFLKDAIKLEGVVGFPKKVEEASIEMEISETFGKGKMLKKDLLLTFVESIKKLVEDHGAGFKGYSLSDK